MDDCHPDTTDKWPFGLSDADHRLIARARERDVTDEDDAPQAGDAR